jgi:hypothetical protein
VGNIFAITRKFFIPKIAAARIISSVVAGS